MHRPTIVNILTALLAVPEVSGGGGVCVKRFGRLFPWCRLGRIRSGAFDQNKVVGIIQAFEAFAENLATLQMETEF